MYKLSSLKIGILAIFLCLSTAVSAAQWATVTAKRAAIFSDVQMSSIIGFVGQGKRVRVGEVAKNRGRLFSIIVNEKIAYIQVNDIATSQSNDVIYSATQRIRDKIDLKTEERKFGVYGGALLANVDFASAERNESSYNLGFYTVGIKGYYRKLSENKGIRTAIEYNYGERDEEVLYWMTFNVDYTWPALTSSVYDMIFFVGAMVSPFATYQVEDLFDLTGYGLGGQAGVDMKFEIPGPWSFNADASYYFLQIFDFDLPDNEFYGSTLNPTINGIKTTFSLTYEY